MSIQGLEQLTFPIPGFEVERVLGRGGVGAVYLAKDPQGREVALKVMPLDTDATRQARFEQEASIGQILKHPDIIEVYDYGIEREYGWIAMEYLDGFELASAMQDKALGLEDRCRVLIRVARALQYAHEQQVVHRDVKPSNIFMTRAGGVRLLDFGISRLADTRITKTGYIVGTPQYMSPEQISGLKIDGRADVFSLGVVAFELLTGSLPWTGENHTQIMMAICARPPPRLRDVMPTDRFSIESNQLDKLDRIVHSAIIRESERRTQSAHDFANQLEDYLAGRFGATADLPPRTVDPELVTKQRIEWAMARAARLQVEEEAAKAVTTNPSLQNTGQTLEWERESKNTLWGVLMLIFGVGALIAVYVLMMISPD